MKLFKWIKNNTVILIVYLEIWRFLWIALAIPIIILSKVLGYLFLNLAKICIEAHEDFQKYISQLKEGHKYMKENLKEER